MVAQRAEAGLGECAYACARAPCIMHVHKHVHDARCMVHGVHGAHVHVDVHVHVHVYMYMHMLHSSARNFDVELELSIA